MRLGRLERMAGASENAVGRLSAWLGPLSTRSNTGGYEVWLNSGLSRKDGCRKTGKTPRRPDYVQSWNRLKEAPNGKTNATNGLERSKTWGKKLARLVLSKGKKMMWVSLGLEVCSFCHSGVIRGVCVTSEKQSEAMFMICRTVGYDCV
ncbi:hypothetical protein CRG98_012088 [Punica granatum]|uniref:Uncharacterized protein n=1 Tax=Punica granatum TaxID=22663 RepID=A0A2I0KG75_PUNGR|nr:hypothetical protein CRG98_012088 [Punica granatum]